MLHKADFGTGLQISHTFLQRGGENGPEFSLQTGWTFVQQIKHMIDVFRFDDDKVHFQVKFAANQLKGKQETCTYLQI